MENGEWKTSVSLIHSLFSIFYSPFSVRRREPRWGWDSVASHIRYSFAIAFTKSARLTTPTNLLLSITGTRLILRLAKTWATS